MDSVITWRTYRVVLYGAPLAHQGPLSRAHYIAAANVDDAVRGALAEDPHREWVHQIGIAGADIEAEAEAGAKEEVGRD